MRRRVRKVLVRAGKTLAGEGARYLFIKDAERITRLSREQIAELQLTRLRDILRYAGSWVPYWRDLFRERRFVPDAVRAISDLEALPVLTKEIIREQGDRMISSEFKRHQLIRRQTGGSTGEPLTFWIDRDSFERQMAIHLRGFRMIGVREGDPMAKIWGYGKSQRLTNAIAPLSGRVFLNAFEMSEADLEGWYQSLRKLSPVAVYGYAAAIFDFARFLGSRGRVLRDLKVVCTTAEQLHPEMRKQIQDSFGVPVADMYGCHEIVRIASECRHGNMHVASDGVALEFDRSAVGDSRRIWVTSLLSRAMPFIRYELGDVGRAVEGACPCGAALPLMTIDGGKEHHIFGLSGGKRIHSTVITKELFTIERLSAFQVRLSSPAKIEIIAVPRSDEHDAAMRDVETTLDRLKQQLGFDISIIARFVDEIPKTPRGKRPVVLLSPSEYTE